MRLPTSQRREIIEDILDIQIFSVMNTVLKDKVRTVSDEMKDFDYKADLAEEKISMQKQFIGSICQQRHSTIEDKKEKVNFLIAESGDLEKKVEDAITHRDNHVGAGSKLKTLNNLKGKIQQKFSAHKKQHQFFVDNTICPTCSQSITEELKANKIDSILKSIEELQVGFQEMDVAIKLEEERDEVFHNYNKAIAQYNADVQNTQKQIQEYQEEIETLQNEKNDSIEAEEKLVYLENEYSKLKKQMSSIKEDKNTLLAASILLKDNGIKTRIIKRYLPVMNKLINQHLQNLEFYVNFELDENFEETIKSRYRDSFSYESFSEGEKARIDIALLLTWRAVAKLKNSVDTNILILDEIFDGSLDAGGTSELGWILRNFDDNTNVFVISHKETLEGKFERTLNVEKVKNYSVIRESVLQLA